MRSAGYLLGTTRSDQPGALATESGLRMLRISGGVLTSLAGQKTQLLVFARTGSMVKSDGRRPRSVEMITQRPTTGSLRSSGMSLSHPRVLARRRASQQRGQRLGRRLAL